MINIFTGDSILAGILQYEEKDKHIQEVTGQQINKIMAGNQKNLSKNNKTNKMKGNKIYFPIVSLIVIVYTP